MERLYTLILDFREGTYISQIKANNEKDALIKGISNLKPQDIEFMGEQIKEKMIEEALYETPTPITGNKNVFITGLSPMGHFSTIHLIVTAMDNE